MSVLVNNDKISIWLFDGTTYDAFNMHYWVDELEDSELLFLASLYEHINGKDIISIDLKVGEEYKEIREDDVIIYNKKNHITKIISCA